MDTGMNHYKFKLPLQVRFADFDLLGHVNNANYLSYFELGRIRYFEDIITEGRQDWKKEGIILAKATIDFRQPMVGYDHYYIAVRCSRIGSKSFDLMYLITREEKNEVRVIAEGTTVLVCFNYERQQTIAMNANWITAIEQYEGIRLRAIG